MRNFSLNYKCDNKKCGATWTTKLDIDFCPKCLGNYISIESRNGGGSAYDLSNNNWRAKKPKQ